MLVLIIIIITIEMVTIANHAAGIPSQAYHAGRPAKERSQVLEDWNEGRVPVVAATIAFGMGIDRASKCHRSLLAWIGTDSGHCRDGQLFYTSDKCLLHSHARTQPSCDSLCL